MPNSALNRAAKILFTFIGGFLILTSLLSIWSKRDFAKRASHVEGRVSRLHVGGSHPEIEYSAEGKNFRYPQGGMIFGYQVGETVEVLYDPQNPGKAILNRFGALYGFHAVFLVMGIAFIAVPRLREKKPTPRSPQ